MFLQVITALLCTQLFLFAAEETGHKQFTDLAPTENFDSDKEGFIILTTNDLSHRLKSLQEFISHKANTQNFRMYVATEDDFGSGTGRSQAFKIREWLQKNHKALDLKYALFIGDGHPETGDVPMIKAGTLRRPSGDRWEKLPAAEKEKWGGIEGDIMPNTGTFPTDYFYVDLAGDWDLDKDTTIASGGDYAEGGITGQADLLVGRIPYYGEQSQYGKAEDVDIILRRSIRYDNETDISWRYNFTQLRQWDMIPEEVFFEKNILEANGINYFRDTCYQTTIGFPGYHFHSKGDPMAHNVAKLARIPLGYTRLGGHGGPTGMHGINSGQVRQYLNDKQPTIVNMGGCDVGKIEHPQNLAYTLLRFHAIATHGGTRSVAGFGGGPSKPYVERLLEDGNSVGEAWWGQYADRYKGRHIGGTAFLINVYGDPTVRPFPTGLDLPYSFIAKPVAPYHRSIQSVDEISKLPPHELSITNNSESPQTVTLTSTKPWLTVLKTEVSIRPGQTQKVKLNFDEKAARALSPGVHEAEVILDDGKGYSTKRLAYLELPNGSMIARFEFDEAPEAKGGFKDRFRQSVRFQIRGDQTAKNYQTEGIRGQAFDASKQGLRNGPDTPVGPNIGSYSVAYWVKKDPSETAPKQLFSLNNFLTFKADKEALHIRLEDFNWYGKVKPNVFEKSISHKWDDQWTHIAVSVDQIQGNADVYINAKLVGSINTKPQLIFAPKGLQLGHFRGAIDELTLYNKSITQAEVRALFHDVFVEAPNPVNKQRGILPGKVTLDFFKGSNIEKLQVSIAPYSNQSNGRKVILPDSEGKFIAQDIKPNTPYIWIAEYEFTHNGKKKKGRGPKWYFMTSDNLIANSDFEGAEFAWKGDARHVRNDPNRAIQGAASMVFDKGKSAYISTKEGIKAGHGYKLKFTARTQWRKKLDVEFYYKDFKNEKTLTKSHFYIYQDRRGNDVTLDFFALKNAPYIGKKLYVRLTSDPEEGSETWVDDISLTPYEHNSHNSNPELIVDPSTLLASAEVGNNLFTIRLLDLVNDPEGSPLTFEKVSGPDWIRVRGQDLMTNFGPTANDIGENKVGVIARDALGGSIEFTVPITVQKQSEDKLVLLPHTAKLSANHLKVGPQKVYGFRDQSDALIWQQELSSGLYEVTLIYNCKAAGAGTEAAVTLGDETTSAKLSANQFQSGSIKLGQINNPNSGLKTLKFHFNSSPPDKHGIEFIRILLNRIQ